MALPAIAVGYGNNSTAQNVFRLTYSQALSSQPDWECYDGSGSFPTTGSANTVLNTIFTGTAGNGNIPMLALVATSSSAPSSAWLPGSPTSGAATANRMKGLTNYVLDPTTPGAGGSIRWNMVLEVPSDATTSSTMSVDLLNRYTYTGSSPSLTFQVNDFGAGGSEGSPSWTAFVPGTNGIRHCRTGTSAGGPYLADIPTSSVEVTTVGVVSS